MKCCSRCKIEKSVANFSLSKQTKSGLHSQCKECASISKKEWYANNKEYAKQTAAVYYCLNKSNIIANVVKNQLLKRKTSVQEKIKHTIRKRFAIALKRNYKAGSAIEKLGCSIEEFKFYIESKFYLGMSWDNYGRGEGKWQLDHIVALCNFNLSDEIEMARACHYTNMQPLWYKDHLIKTTEDIHGHE